MGNFFSGSPHVQCVVWFVCVVMGNSFSGSPHVHYVVWFGCAVMGNSFSDSPHVQYVVGLGVLLWVIPSLAVLIFIITVQMLSLFKSTVFVSVLQRVVGMVKFD